MYKIKLLINYTNLFFLIWAYCLSILSYKCLKAKYLPNLFFIIPCFNAKFMEVIKKEIMDFHDKLVHYYLIFNTA